MKWFMYVPLLILCNLSSVYEVFLTFSSKSTWGPTNICRRCTVRSRVMCFAFYSVSGHGNTVSCPQFTVPPGQTDQTRPDDWVTELSKVLIYKLFKSYGICKLVENLKINVSWYRAIFRSRISWYLWTVRKFIDSLKF
jgi:hypothetical protein